MARASEGLIVVDAERTRAALPFPALIPALREAFAQGAQVPPRHHHHLPQPDGTTAVLLLMPAWRERGGFLGIKIVTVFPGNAQRALPGVSSTYLLCDGETGRHLALIDGNEITVRRTVGVAALAASFLARPDAASLLIVGAGRIASQAAEALREVRPIRRVAVWDRTPQNAATLVDKLQAQGFEATVATSLQEAAGAADIITCATLSAQPLIRAEWVRPGTHLDLIGSFTEQMREADDACFARGRVFVDTRDALVESGDLIEPLRTGALTANTVGTLGQLCAGEMPGRRAEDSVTVFKAVGTALADIAAAVLVFNRIGG